MVKVATARDEFEARILAARLGSDGIVWELRGNVGGPYPIGAVDVLVGADDEEVARQLLVADDDDEEDGEALPLRGAWMPAVVLVTVVLIGLARILALL